MKRSWWIGAALMVCLLAGALPAQARSRYDRDDDYRRYNDQSFRLRLGMFTPEGDSDFFDDTAFDFTGEGRDCKPRRCALPITALRLIPPSSSAIWLAVIPDSHILASVAMRSSVQLMPVFVLQLVIAQTTMILAAARASD